jgi:two-component system chemotaxis response regulator CheB
MTFAAATHTPATSRRIRVMIVDDAIVVRGLFTRWLEAEADLELVASLRTGREAVNQLERADPDVVVLDVDMPELDGIAALPLLLEKKRDLVVIMASTLTRRNAEISLRALSLGAADYIPKPASSREVTASAAFRRELIEKIRQLGLRCKRLRGTAPARPAMPYETKPTLQPKFRAAPQTSQETAPPPLSLRPMPMTPPRVLVIGSSTGGPQALNLIVSQIGSVIDAAPVFITQHMPPTFTAILAEHLTRLGKRPVHEAKHGEAVRAGTVYLAPGGKHMTVVRHDGNPAIALSDGALINFCKPAVDPLFSSAAAVWGNKVLALVLTGMGSDGLAGAKAVVAAGGAVIAQDEATSVVWGMPGQVATAGLCSAVLPLPEIAGKLTRMFTGERP